MSKKSKGSGSQDIRSFFQPKSSAPSPKVSEIAFTSKKRTVPLVSSDEDIIPGSPVVKKQEKVLKKRKANIVNSDSEGEIDFVLAKEVKQKKAVLKPVSVLDVFGSGPVKQAKIPDVPKVEKSVDVKDNSKDRRKRKHDQDSSTNKTSNAKKSKKGSKPKEAIDEIAFSDDPDLEQTLLELDESILLENVQKLGKTINDAVSGSGSVQIFNESFLMTSSKSSKGNTLEVTKDVKVHKKELYQDKKELNQDKKELKQDKKELKQDKKELKQDKKELKQDKKELKQDKKELKQDKKDKISPIKTSTSTSSSADGKTPKKKPLKEDPPVEFDNDLAQEKYEKKRHSAILYQKYLNRSGPAHRGTKEIPKGKPDCLNNLCFIRTGVLDSLDDTEFEDLIKSHGGRVVRSVSKKVNYVVAGEDPGPAKLEKAQSYDIKIISEDELLDLIRTKSGIKPLHDKKEDLPKEKSKEKEKEIPTETILKAPKSNEASKVKSSSKSHNKEIQSPKKEKLDTKTPSKPLSKTVEPLKKLPSEKSKTEIPSTNLSWTEKYKPVNTKGIIGQQEEKSNMKRLKTWLENWYKNHSGKNKPKLVKPSPWAKNDDGSYFKAALLSGPPGVGKTTTANLVAKELGFDVVEFNASDTRSKKLLHEEVSTLLNSKSLAGFFSDGSQTTSKHVLLMDEVDGMAGNEDRGGMQELITLIKNTKIPIICMCNDRNHQKVRSLAGYCVDLRFGRPKLEQIRGAMMTVCFKEGIKIDPKALSEVINGAGMDIRQILTHLSIWSAEGKSLSSETATKEAQSSQKDTPLGQWEVCQKVFSAKEHENMSFGDRSRLFYHDYSMAPLFVQENYLGVVPKAPAKDHLKLYALAADAISMGDLIDTKIRRTNNWSLLDVEAMCASVLPGHYVEGHFNRQINFPSWLGKNSKKNKFTRILSELQAHMRTSISGSKSAVNLDYVTHLRDRIALPLVKRGLDGIPEALDVMHSYNLLREDLDNIVELSQWPKGKNPMNLIDSKIKAAFTRAYNKDSAMLPYAIEATATKKRSTVTSEVEEYQLEGEDEAVSDDSDTEDVTKDAMVKAKKVTSKKAPKSTESGASTSKRGAGGTTKTKAKKGKK